MTAPKRRWFSFSLRTLFVMVTAFAVALPVIHRYLEWREAHKYDALIKLITTTVKPVTSGPYP